MIQISSESVISRLIVLLIFIFLGYLVELNGQAQLVSDYRFDNCSADDYVGSNDGFILGSPCNCGVRSTGFKLNGTSDFVEFGSGLNAVFSGDFSISFTCSLTRLTMNLKMFFHWQIDVGQILFFC